MAAPRLGLCSGNQSVGIWLLAMPTRVSRGAASGSPALSNNFAIAAADAGGHMRKLEEIEAELIRMAIARYDGRMSEVARRLGIGRSTLYRKLKELGLDDGLETPTAEESPRAVNE